MQLQRSALLRTASRQLQPCRRWGRLPLHPAAAVTETVERVEASTSPSSPGSGTPTPSPVVLPRRTLGVYDVLKFNSIGPEVINGRLAMIGMLAAAAVEPSSSQTVVYHMQHAPIWAYASLVLWIYASFVPLLKGAKMEGFGVFTPRAELANGRAAMLGFAILLILEANSGVPFF